MTTSFPTGLDALTNPTGSSSLTSPDHAGQHADINDAVEALEAKVGVNGSAVTTSLDYLVRNIDANNGLMQVRRDTAANWASTNPTLAVGEIGFETDTGKFKIGASSARVYAIGDIGPAGGKIFITPSTAGNSTGKYFEIAPSGVEVTRSWATGANQSNSVVGADGSAIGTGAQNTIDIAAQSGNVAATCAASYCNDLVFGGKSDWFLPSWYELGEVYTNRIVLNTNLNSFYYYASTELGLTSAVVISFATGTALNGGKVGPWYVRPVRSFTATAEWEYAAYATDASDIAGATLASNVTNSSLNSVGTLGSLTVTGDVTVDTNTLKVDSTNNRVGVGTASPAYTLDVNGTVEATQYLQGTDYLSPYQGFRNKVINGNMSVWQRGTSVAVNTLGYTADRWFHQSYNGATISRQPTSDTSVLPNVQYCARVQRNSGATATNFMYFTQSMETQESIKLTGKTVTFSFYARKGANFPSASGAFQAILYYGTGTDQNLILGYTGSGVAFSNTFTLTSSWVRYSVTGTIPTTSTELTPLFGYTPTGTAGANEYFEITGVQLEEGSVATPLEQRPIQQELALCQRYYQKSYSQGVTPATVTDAGIYAFYGTSNVFALLNGTIQLRVPMRVAPTTITYYRASTGGVGWDYFNASGGAGFVTPTTAYASDSSFVPYLSLGGASYVGGGMYGQWTASAELG